MPESLLDVISAAVDGKELPVPAQEPTDVTTAATGEDTTAPAPVTGDAGGTEQLPDTGAEPPEGSAGAPASAGEGESTEDVTLGPDGRPRDATGKFVSAKKTGEEAATEAKKPGEQPAAEVKKPDPINDPIPQGLKQATSERMQKLVDIAKEVTTKHTQAVSDLETIMAPIQAAGVTVEQFQDTMDMLRLVNSRDPTDRAEAHRRVQELADEIAKAAGITPVGVDPLTGFNDLVQRVQGGTLTRKDAEEIAAVRRQQAAQQQLQQETRQQAQASQQMQQVRQQAAAAVRSLETSYRGLDPQFAAKDALIKADAAFVAQVRAAHPSQWAQMYADKYATIKLPPVAASAAAAPAAARPAAGQPLRAKNPAGGTVAAPSSLFEAISAGIAQAG